LATKSLDIAIAGAGPAGLAAALALRRQGHRIVVYEQFDTPKPIGSGLILQPTGLAVLDWLGLGKRMRGLGSRIDRLTGTASGSGKLVLDVRYEALGPERGFAVHRAALFNVLHEAVQAAQIPIETASHVNSLDAGVLNIGKGRKTSRYDLVIDALGARSPLRRSTDAATRENPLEYGAVWASLPWPSAPFDPHALTQVYNKASVMIGVLPIGRVREDGHELAAFFWSLKVKDYDAWKVRGIEAWKSEVMRHWPEAASLLSHIQTPDDLSLARYQHHTMPRPYGERMICIGDSAHSTSPQLGQGANMALLDVMALSEAMKNHGEFIHFANDYAHRRRWHVRTYQTLSKLFTPFYQSDSTVLPWLRDSLVSQASRLPMAQRLLARMVAGTLVDPIRRGLKFEYDVSGGDAPIASGATWDGPSDNSG
jgi:2-polyprenyl-6-methoxyphenol hydroxylase-like FAD-dependent oxidoreductase